MQHPVKPPGLQNLNATLSQRPAAGCMQHSATSFCCIAMLVPQVKFAAGAAKNNAPETLAKAGACVANMRMVWHAIC